MKDFEKAVKPSDMVSNGTTPTFLPDGAGCKVTSEFKSLTSSDAKRITGEVNTKKSRATVTEETGAIGTDGKAIYEEGTSAQFLISGGSISGKPVSAATRMGPNNNGWMSVDFDKPMAEATKDKIKGLTPALNATAKYGSDVGLKDATKPEIRPSSVTGNKRFAPIN
jgi:hypothetical protein